MAAVALVAVAGVAAGTGSAQADLDQCNPDWPEQQYQQCVANNMYTADSDCDAERNDFSAVASRFIRRGNLAIGRNAVDGFAASSHGRIVWITPELARGAEAVVSAGVGAVNVPAGRYDVLIEGGGRVEQAPSGEIRVVGDDGKVLLSGRTLPAVPLSLTPQKESTGFDVALQPGPNRDSVPEDAHVVFTVTDGPETSYCTIICCAQKADPVAPAAPGVTTPSAPAAAPAPGASAEERFFKCNTDSNTATPLQSPATVYAFADLTCSGTIRSTFASASIQMKRRIKIGPFPTPFSRYADIGTPDFDYDAGSRAYIQLRPFAEKRLGSHKYRTRYTVFNVTTSGKVTNPHAYHSPGVRYSR